MKIYRAAALSIALLGAPSTAQSGIQGTPSRSDLIPRCVPTVIDEATGNCLTASSIPELGKLYPLGPEFSITPFHVRINPPLELNSDLGVFADTYMNGDLSVNGAMRANGQVGVGNFYLTQVSHDLHIREYGDVSVYLEADINNSDEFSQPSITFSQDGGQVVSRIGFFGGQNEFSITNDADYDQRFNLPGGNADWEFWKLAGIAVDRRAYIDQSGNMAIDGIYSSGGADVAEYYPVAGPVGAPLEPGEVVAFTGAGITVERAVAGAGERLAGIVSSAPGVVLGLTYTDEDEIGENPEDLCAGDKLAAIRHEIQVNRRAPLALTGRVPCKVTAANGPIRPGDLLTASAVPGHAMKATEAGAVLGTALEGWTGGEGTILVLANLGYFSPTADLERRVAELEARVRTLLKAR